MPTYNEMDCIEHAVSDLQRYVFPFAADMELIVIDDGSTDDTGIILDELAKTELHLRVIHQSNGGHGKALLTGLNAAQGDFLMLIDSDRQILLNGFEPLWYRAQKQDGLFGVRRRRGDAFSRRLLTSVIRHTLPILFGIHLYDANVPFKIFRRHLWVNSRSLVPPDTFAPSLFIAVFAIKNGYQIEQVEIEHIERQTGTGSIRKWKLIKCCARAFIQLLSFRKKLLTGAYGV